MIFQKLFIIFLTPKKNRTDLKIFMFLYCIENCAKSDRGQKEETNLVHNKFNVHSIFFNPENTYEVTLFLMGYL